MASQRVLLFTIGGVLADNLWRDICRWSDQRRCASKDEWSHEDWPRGARVEVDAFVDRLTQFAYTPPILYRSEHVDCWSMGDVYMRALAKDSRDATRCLFTEKHEIIATRVRCVERVVPNEDIPAETQWLYARINEAISAWDVMTEERLVLLVRNVLGGLWTDEEVAESLQTLPSWWTDVK